jgi:hypothetical protein
MATYCGARLFRILHDSHSLLFHSAEEPPRLIVAGVRVEVRSFGAGLVYREHK